MGAGEGPGILLWGFSDVIVATLPSNIGDCEKWILFFFAKTWRLHFSGLEIHKNSNTNSRYHFCERVAGKVENIWLFRKPNRAYHAPKISQ